jgi:hypothetical protein
MKRRRCSACGVAFRPRSQVPDQMYCSASACQQARRRRWQRAKRQSDADYRENQARAQRAWVQGHRDYWREYRRTHPQHSESNRWLTLSGRAIRHQRAEVGAWGSRGVDLAGGSTAAGRGGGSEILSKRACAVVCRLVMSRFICARPLESPSTLCRTAARLDDIASSCCICARPLESPSTLCRTAARLDDIASSCCSREGERAVGAGAACGTETTCLEDRQTKEAATPTLNMIRNAIASDIRLSSNDDLISNRLCRFSTRMPPFRAIVPPFRSERLSRARVPGL